MRGRAFWWVGLAAVAGLLVLPGTALAQTGAIAGSVTDATGGVLPGVTVNASSPAAITSRTTVTDGAGLYTLPALVPGTYVVEFTLPGFSTVLREGVELSAGFTANIDTQLAVGGVEETVTVTGATPTVDVQNVRTQAVLDLETLNALPNAQNISAFAALTLGVTIVGSSGIGGQDVGGTGGEMGIAQIHNNRMTDMKVTQEGMNVNNAMGTNGGIFRAGQHFNMEGVAEVTIGHTGMSAETETAGMTINYIPKEGGNIFSGSGRLTFTNESFQSDNTGDLAQRGASTPGSIKKLYDYAGAFGGPIKQDKLWFFTAHRWWGDQVYSPGSFYNGSAGTFAANGVPVYKAGTTRGYIENYNQENSGRVTWQASAKDKLTYFGNYGDQCICFRGVQAIVAPAAGFHNALPQNHLSQVTYTSAVSNSVLVEAGFSILINPFGFTHVAGVSPTDVAIFSLSPLILYNARGSGGLPYNDLPGGGGLSAADQQNMRGALSYVTGSHSFKFGFNWAHGYVEANGESNHVPGFGPGRVRTIGGNPYSLDVYAQPYFNRSDYRNVGIYAQDQWTLDRVTVNAGLRIDLFDGWSPAGTAQKSAFTPGFAFSRIDKPTYRNVSPRLGFAWDVRGDGKTALKASAGQYMAGKGAGNSQVFNPSRSISTTTTRLWGDANGDFIVDGDGSNALANGELGPSTNPSFGTPVIIRSYNDDFATKNRDYTWQYSVSVDQELRDNVRVTVGYHRTQHFNQYVTDNTLVTAADYERFSVTPTAGAAAGTVLNEFYDLTPAAAGRFAAAFLETRNEATFGDRTEVFNGVDTEIQARFDNGALIQGGFSLGQVANNNCFTVDSPEQANFLCNVVSPWWSSGGQIKFSGLLPLPGGVDISAVYQNLAGIEIRTQQRVLGNSAAILAQLGRPLTRGTSVVLDTVARNSDFEARLSQLDFRVAKSFTGAGGRVLVTLDLYNALNANTVRSRINEIGSAYGNVRSFMAGRLIKIGGQFSWN